MNDVWPLVQADSASNATAALAAEAFVHAHQPTVYRFALSILGDPADAEDAAQDALVAALLNLDKYRGEAAFTTWLYAITLNVCRKHLNRQRRGERLLALLQGIFHLRGEPPAGRPEEVTLRTEVNTDLARALRSLDEKHLMPVVLRYYHDLPVAEIARLLGLSEGTVHSRLFTARERLRLALQVPAEPAAEA